MKKHLLFLFVASFFFATTSSAQQLSPGNTQQPKQVNFSNETLKKFIDANEKAAAVQQKSQAKMISAIEAEGMEVEEFNKAVRTLQNPQRSGEDSDISEEKRQKAQKVAKKITKIQTEMQTKIEAKIKEAGLTTQKFQEIMTAYQSDPELQQKIESLKG